MKGGPLSSDSRPRKAGEAIHTQSLLFKDVRRRKGRRNRLYSLVVDLRSAPAPKSGLKCPQAFETPRGTADPWIRTYTGRLGLRVTTLPELEPQIPESSRRRYTNFPSHLEGKEKSTSIYNRET